MDCGRAGVSLSVSEAEVLGQGDSASCASLFVVSLEVVLYILACVVGTLDLHDGSRSGRSRQVETSLDGQDGVHAVEYMSMSSQGLRYPQSIKLACKRVRR